MIHGTDTRCLLLMTQSKLGYTHWFTFTSLRKKRGLEIPGALRPAAVKELRLMINFPHILPLPDLSKRAEPRNEKWREEKKAGEESLGYSN